MEFDNPIIPANMPIQALKGMLKKPKVPVTIEQMNDIIAAQGVVSNI